MTRVLATDRGGREHAIEIGSAQTVMEALRDANVDLAAICGGVLSCATCHVFVEDAASLPPPSEDELAMIEGLSCYREGQSRLSCQLSAASLHRPLRLTVAPEE
ncbi:2Fe-2S iron-sulfur cluster-binding protein [Hydrocarboniphaga sp.]|uniref:2Fe-2S iron-sulfur cluster-binding protein n=1 Tax=Hydrocarboniphaga sp. TaxID=2033016 RepID=UPI003D0A79D9